MWTIIRNTEIFHHPYKLGFEPDFGALVMRMQGRKKGTPLGEQDNGDPSLDHRRWGLPAAEDVPEVSVHTGPSRRVSARPATTSAPRIS